MAIKTVGQFAREEQVPEWRVRRIVDSLSTKIPRAGLYRLLTEKVQAEIRDRLAAERSDAD